MTLPPARGGASDETVAFAAGLIDRSGKAPVIEAALAHRTGRPRPLPARAVLTALLCLALDDWPLFLTEATRLLFCQLSAASAGCAASPAPLAATGLPGRLPAGPLLLRRHLLGDGPLGAAKNRRLSEQDLTARTKKMTPAQIQAARGRLERSSTP